MIITDVTFGLAFMTKDLLNKRLGGLPRKFGHGAVPGQVLPLDFEPAQLIAEAHFHCAILIVIDQFTACVVRYRYARFPAHLAPGRLLCVSGIVSVAVIVILPLQGLVELPDNA